MSMSNWLKSLKKIFGGSQTVRPLRKTSKPTNRSCRPSLESLEDRVTPSGTPFSGAGYDGTWDGATLIVNTAAADGALSGSTLSIGTIQDNGNTFVRINGTEISAVLTNEVQTLTVTNTDQVGVKFDLSSVSSSDFSYSCFAASVTGVTAGTDTLTVNATARTWTINAFDGGTAAGSDYTVTFASIPNIVAGAGADTFNFTAAKDVDGSIDGGGGTNTFDFSNGGTGGYSTAISAVVSGTNSGSITANDTFSFANIQSLTGGSGADTFTFDDTSATPSLVSINAGSGAANTLDFSAVNNGSITADFTGPNAGSVSGAATLSSFTHVQTLDGSAAGGDTYTIEPAAYTGAITINGGVAGGNTLSYPSTSPSNGNVSVNLQSLTATGVSAFSNIDTATIAATDGTYTLTGADAANAWEISGANAGNINESNFTFSGFNVLQAGAGGDAFTLDSGVTFAGNIHGSSGTDTLNLGSASQTVSLTADSANGFSGTVGTISGSSPGYTAIDIINGNGGSNTLNGESAASDWNLSDGEFVNSATLYAAGSGYSQGDVVTVVGGTGTAAQITVDDVDGAGAILTFHVSNAGNYTIFPTSAVDTTDSSSGTGAQFNLFSNTGSQYVTGSDALGFSNFQTLNGGTSGDNFTLYGNYQGTLNGGVGNNTFVFDDTSVLTGSIVGNTGTDTLDYSDYSNPITVTLTADASSGFTGTETGSISGTFSKIDVLLGTGSSSDSLTGEGVTASWTLGASPYTYTHGSDALSFTDIANLNGGSGVDTFNVSDDFQGNLNGGQGNDSFVFTASGSVTGTVTGGSTSPGDTLDYSGYGSGVVFTVTSASTTTGATGTATGIGGTFGGITNLIGSTSYTDSLTVAYSATAYTSATWTVSGGASGTNSFTDNASKTFNFKQIENLTGSGGDTFNVTASHTGNLASPSGTNAFNVTSNSTTTVTLTGSIYGGTGVDTVTINGNSTNHPASVTGNISTGGGGDIVHLTGHASVGGQVNAGDATSPDGTLSYNGFTTSAVSVNIATGAATAIDGGLPGGIAYFTVFTGASNASDKLTGPNTANTWDITANNAGNINSGSIAFSQFKNLVGGTSSDDFTFGAGDTVTSINGGAGANTADFSNYAAGITAAITGANAGTINTNAVAFSAIGSLVGSSSNTSGNTWQFKANGSLSGNISSGNSLGGFSYADSLTYNSTGGYTKPVTVNLSNSTATLLGGTFNNVYFFTGSSSTANTLVGGFMDTITVTGSNAGYDIGATFTKFQNLTGASGGNNTFVFNSGASISGKVNGGTGYNAGNPNTLDISAESGAEAVNLATGKANFTGGFLNINTFAGNDNAGTSLTGANVTSTWALNANDSGVINSNTTFSGFAKLIGGSLADTFAFADTVTIQTSINGGAGNNTMDLSAYTSSLDVSILSNNGGSVDAVPAFSNIQNITGGSGGNDFDMYAGRGVSGALNGGSGRNSLDYTRYTTAVTVSLVNAGTGAATNIHGGISNFKDVYGSLTAKNTLTGDGGNDILIGGAAVDTIKASVSGTTTGHAILIGGGGKDAITADNGYDILIGGSTSLMPSDLDTALVTYLAGVTDTASFLTAKNGIETTYSLSASVTSTPASTITNAASATSGNTWDIINVITTLKKLKSGDIRTFV